VGENGLRESRDSKTRAWFSSPSLHAGWHPALDAIESGKDLAVASKEILVMAGENCDARGAGEGRAGVAVDSEHNANFSMSGGKHRHRGAETRGLGVGCRRFDVSDVRRIILTASGGPFREHARNQIADVTVEQALKHPTWTWARRSRSIRRRCSTKVEMIEAHWLSAWK